MGQEDEQDAVQEVGVGQTGETSAHVTGVGETQRRIAEGAERDPSYTHQAPTGGEGRGTTGTGRAPENITEYIRNVQAYQNPVLMAAFGRQDQPMTPYDWQMVGVNQQFDQYNRNQQERGEALGQAWQQGAYQPALAGIMQGVTGMSNNFGAQRAGLQEQFASQRHRQMAEAQAQQRLQGGTQMDAMQQARLRQQMDQAHREAMAGLQQKQNEQQLAQYAEAGNIATKAQQLMNQRMGTNLQYTLGTPQEAFDFSLLSTPITNEQGRRSLSGFPYIGDRLPGDEWMQGVGFRPMSTDASTWSGDTFAGGGYIAPGARQGNSGGFTPQAVLQAWKNQQGC